MVDADRRHDVRHVACFPGVVELGDEHDKTIAMIADVAAGGARLLLRRPDLRVDETVRLELHISLEGAPRVAMGRVVRVESLPESRASLWTHEAGVEFEAPLPLTQEETDALAKREELFGKRPDPKK